MIYVNPVEKLELALSDASGVHVGNDVDRDSYINELMEEIRRHQCDPFQLSAIVMPPGFPGVSEGDIITGCCVAYKSGYWLVYQPDQDRFYCFWGTDRGNLGAYGVYGSPLYCWSA